MRVTSSVLRTAVSALIGVGLGLGLLTAPAANAVAPTGTPVLSAPADGSDVAGNPVFTWGAVPGAAKYRIQVSTSSGFSPVTWTLDTLNVNATPEVDLPVGTLFWRVAATDGTTTGVGPWSDSQSFTVEGSTAPNPFGGPAVHVFHYPDQTPLLQWAAMAGVKSYKVEIDDETGFLAPVTVLTTPNTSLAVTSAVAFTKPYYWRVSGVRLSGVLTAPSEIGSFEVDWPNSAGQPSLLSPPDGVIDPVSDVVLTWQPVVGAKSYQVQVSADSFFTNNITDDQTVVGTQYSPDVTYPNGAYYWRVRPIDPTVGARQGPWSEQWSFRRATPVPDAPTPVYPADGATVSQFAFEWNPVPTGSAYEIQWDVDGNWTSGALACTTYHTRWAQEKGRPAQPKAALTGKLPGITAPYGNGCSDSTPNAGTWRWRVRAIDQPSGQTGPFSASRTVTFAPTLAGVAPVQLPYDGYLTPSNCEATDCTTISDTPELSWSPVLGADHYIVYLAYDRDFTNEIQRYDVAGTRFTPRESLPDNSTGASYYWWVQPCSGSGVLALCTGNEQLDMSTTAHAFRKLAAPVVPKSPVTATTTTVTDVVALTWYDTYATQPTATGAAQYQVQVATDPSFGSLSMVDDATVDQTTYEAYLKTYPDGNYYWRVRAIDGSGLLLSWNTPQTFSKTSTRPGGLSVAKLDPYSAVPVLSWDSTPYVSGYLVEVYSGKDPLFPVAKKLSNVITVKQPIYAPDIAFPAGTYSWRVRRLDPSGNPGQWQETMGGDIPTFDVVAPVPFLTAPADGAAISGNGLLFTWTPVQGAAQYTFEASTVPTFASVIQRINTANTAWAPATLYPDSVTIYWRVKALDSANNVLSTSAVRTVTKDAKAPTATYNLTTATKVLKPTVTVTFSENVTGVTASSVYLRKAVVGTAVATTMLCQDAAGIATSCGGTVRKVVLTTTANVVPGEHYEAAVTTDVADLAGNAAVASVGAFRALVAVEQNSGSPTYSTGWSTVSNSLASGTTYARTTTKSASSSWTFRGTGVKLTYMATAYSGRMALYVDGVLKGTVDQYYSSTARRTFSVAGLVDKVHTLKLVDIYTKQAASKGYYVSVDALATS